ncbi:hypothetical protein ACFE04_019720 [Oxalis oulophora]
MLDGKNVIERDLSVTVELNYFVPGRRYESEEAEARSGLILITDQKRQEKGAKSLVFNTQPIKPSQVTSVSFVPFLCQKSSEFRSISALTLFLSATTSSRLASPIPPKWLDR